MNETKKNRLRLFLRLLLSATIAFIWFNSFLGREDSASLSRMIYEWLLSVGIPIPSEHFIRKLAHFCEYGLLGCELTALFWLRSGLRFQSLCNSAFAALLTAVTDETIQIFSGRGSALTDVLLDFSGAVTGILFMSLLIHLIGKRTRQRES